MDKEQLRNEALKNRKALSAETFELRSRKVVEQARQFIKANRVQKVHLFLPIKKNKEVNTWPIYEYLISSEQFTPIVSKTNFKDHSLTHHPMKAGDLLEESRYGIPEPTHNETISIDEIDLVFVPLLAFDRKGNRIGYGAGFYDRFLASCRPGTLKVGLSISEPLDELIASEVFDIPLDICINHTGLHDFR